MKDKLYLLAIMFVALSACKDPDEPIPAYIDLESFTFDIKPNQGTGKHHFKDVWVYVNDEYLGAYELPIKIPVTHKAPFDLRITPGIRKNGGLNEPVRFTFVDPFSITMNTAPGIVEKVVPDYHYASDIQFPVIEDFDRFHFFNEDKDGNPETAIVLTAPEETFEGSNSGLISLTAQNPLIHTWHDFHRKIPVTPNKVFIELHYKSDIPFYIGLVGLKGADREDLINGAVLPSANWNKIYFDFTDITNASKSDSYKLALIANFIADTSKTEQKIWLDNIKVTTR
ncbi:MAG: hypothetical protein IPH93_17075 [Saprospiraceae bacterium]|nr:hypothetical protein [Saprospiraceae bacterium]